MASVAPQGELLERGARARLLARQAVGELTRELKETEGRLRQLEYEERMHLGRRDQDETAAGAAVGAKRGRDEESGEGGGGSKAQRASHDGEALDSDGVAAQQQESTSEPGTEAQEAPMKDADGAAAAAPEAAAAQSSDGAMEPSEEAPAPEREPPEQRKPPPRPVRNVDEAGKSRTRKMFGMLRGTLQRASADLSSSSARGRTSQLQQQQLAKVDSKLASDRAKLLEFQKEFIGERKAVETEHRDTLRERRAALDERLLRLGWDAHKLALSQFLKTRTAPPIYYEPRKHNEATAALRKQHAEAIMQELRDADSPLLREEPLDELHLDLPQRRPVAASADKAHKAADADGDATMGDESKGGSKGSARRVKGSTRRDEESAEEPKAELEPIEKLEAETAVTGEMGSLLDE